MYISIIIPVMNERDNIYPLLSSIAKALKTTKYEVIFVDDGSTDATPQEILKHSGMNVKLIVFARNFGQTCAMTAGIEAASGEYIATIDGDLQNDPEDIPLMLKKLIREKLDMVTGIRVKRHDSWILRKLPSRIANFLIRKLSGVNIQDLGCTLKVFRRPIAQNLKLYGELHRFIPIIAHMQGAKMGEIPVKHHARQFGISKYGIGRTFRVLSDLLLLLFFQKYHQKPMHLFGFIGFILFSTGVMINLYMIWQKILGYDIGHRPLFFIGILCMITSIQFITAGFLAELLMRVYYSSPQNRPYQIIAQYHNGECVQIQN